MRLSPADELRRRGRRRGADQDEPAGTWSRGRCSAMAWERPSGPPIAHRGLWASDGAPENSLKPPSRPPAPATTASSWTSSSAPTARRSCSTMRAAGADDRRRGPAPQTTPLLSSPSSIWRATDETIPTLSETLTLVGHRALVLIEVKTGAGEVGALEQRVHEILIDHNGPTAIIGFNPYSHAWFAQRHPKILRGLDSYAYADEAALKTAPGQRRAFAALEHVAIAKPHFLRAGAGHAALPSAPTPCAGTACRWWRGRLRSPEAWARAEGLPRQPDLRGPTRRDRRQAGRARSQPGLGNRPARPGRYLRWQRPEYQSNPLFRTTSWTFSKSPGCAVERT